MVALSLLCLLIVAVAFGIGLRGPMDGLEPALWLPVPLASLLTTVTLIRLSRRGGLPAESRRFWRHLSISCGCVLAGTSVNAYDTLAGGHPPTYLSTIPQIAYGGSVVMNLWAMSRLPLRLVSRGEVVRAGLDGAVVLLAAGAFSWHYVTLPVVQASSFDTAAIITGMITFTMNMVTLFAVGKVALAGRAHLAPRVLPLLTTGLIGGPAIAACQRFLLDKPWLSTAQLSVPFVMTCTLIAAYSQLNADDTVPRRQLSRRLPVWLPYLAIGGVDALLLSCLRDHDPDAMPIAVTAVLLSGLVVLRQQTVFRENDRLVARLDHGATHDILTGLPNRALFTDRLAGTLDAEENPGRRVSVALIDLDDFKTVNDTLGHGVGDALLIAVAGRLTTAVRAEDTVARLGGDEFVVILDDLEPRTAEQIAHRMIGALAEPVVADGHELLVRASIGIADGRAGEDPADLLRRADIAMYAAKHDGGSGVERYTPGMAGTVADTAALGAQLRHAITDRQMFLVYQPIVALDTGRLRGVEALVRWAHPTMGVVPPHQFVPVAERTGLIVPLGDWVLREACEQFAVWHAAHGPSSPGVLNVNVSSRQLRDAGFVDRVLAVLAETGIPPYQLTLEITESTAVSLGEAVAGLDALRRHGVRISLDDFGTGQSTLTLLHELPVDQLKLDRSFTQGTDTSRRDTMPAAVIALAKAVGLDLVAEGVETAEQAERLAHLGYRHAQGYHFARPLPAAEIDTLLASGHAELLSHLP
ncbi:putative bifunctional diguanylate cyclase/phosphodiesterase [Actinoplanes rectilineatus]|uniref:putative bifunctional diguanylate cyclase/phosphodiesterase n=1 Tax=Actinoplanes rectilineatus TaxID=113571 RepID=UPI0005F2BE00|nr:bifunctional diguanylate cyclase/phosphodiesterase [Actinoplanes rectilineatus]